MQTKLHINLHQGIIDVEGDKDLVKMVYADFKDHLLKKAVSAPVAPVKNPQGNGSEVQETPSNGIALSTDAIAARLSVGKAPDLVIAAVAHLMLTQGKEKCTRKEINDEMKGATTYYKKNMTSNLTNALETLVKAKRLNPISKDVYALSADEKKSLEAQLAQQG